MEMVKWKIAKEKDKRSLWRKDDGHATWKDEWFQDEW